ncbi:DUF3298 domain-containing protein [Mariniflexile aquimaris]|uniref:DUF3298 domain-containing protein n=1 Tax=Mariniflexile aquimaris TaxID=881009 RepID=A0ABW3BPB5_9FLAO
MVIKKQFLFVLSLFILFACNEDPKTAFTEINITTDTNTLVEANIPSAVGGTLITNGINAEINTVVMAALQVGDADSLTTKSIEESINLFNDEYKAFNKDFPDSTLPWEAQIDGEILYESPKIITVAITSYVNTGGAHGNTKITFLNFDAQTGKRLRNTELLKDVEGFNKIAKAYLKDALKEEEVLFDADSFQLPENIGYTMEGLVLLYNTYEIASYATGLIEFTIPYEKANNYLVFNSSK